MRTRHYTGGKFFLWKFVVGKFWLKTFGGKFLMNTCGWEIFGRNVLVEMPYLISLNPLFSKKKYRTRWAFEAHFLSLSFYVSLICIFHHKMPCQCHI